MSKRSLIILLSSLDESRIEDITSSLTLLRKKHLVVFANLRNKILDDVREQEVQSLQDANRQLAINEYINSRNIVFEKLQKAHILCLDVTPEQLPICLVNQYFDLKQAGVF